MPLSASEINRRMRDQRQAEQQFKREVDRANAQNQQAVDAYNREAEARNRKVVNDYNRQASANQLSGELQQLGVSVWFDAIEINPERVNPFRWTTGYARPAQV